MGLRVAEDVGVLRVECGSVGLDSVLAVLKEPRKVRRGEESVVACTSCACAGL